MDGKINGMKTTIDAAGRLVIPKAMRQAAGIGAGTEVEVFESNGTLVIAPTYAPLCLVDTPDGTVAVPTKGDLPVLTAAQVRAALEAVRS